MLLCILLLLTPTVPALPVFKWLGVSSLWIYRAVTWTVLVCGFVVALIVGGVRFWLLPNIENYRETIARELSEATKQHITIGKLEGRWSGFNLQLTLGDIAMFDKAGQPALKLARVDSTLSWWSLVYGSRVSTRSSSSVPISTSGATRAA